MQENETPFCPECADGPEAVETPQLDRRGFIRVAGGAAGLLAVGSVPAVARAARETPKAAAKPAESLVRELHAGLSDEQKKQVVLPWDAGVKNGRGRPMRLGMYNSAIQNKKIGDVYTKPQQELIERILKAISSGEDGYRRISRNGTFDGSGSLSGCGATIFGEPGGGQKYSWVFTGHHLTVRCDGNSEEGAAFGGPMYYGHSPNGYSPRNIFNFQTRSVLSVFDALSEAQRKKAVVPGTPGEQEPSVRLRPAKEAKPGISIHDLTKDQRELVEVVMRDLLSPYRKEDADEVLDILKATGGMDKVHLAFYEDARMNDKERWHFWRLEGPGFVWNYRVLPHVHCYVNISSRIKA
jgi:uncharacterized protein DUF3500